MNMVSRTTDLHLNILVSKMPKFITTEQNDAVFWTMILNNNNIQMHLITVSFLIQVIVHLYRLTFMLYEIFALCHNSHLRQELMVLMSYLSRCVLMDWGRL